MIGINCPWPLVEFLANAIGCKVGSFLIVYLGIPISDSRLSIYVWDKILERVKLKLDFWKPRYLSLGGKVTLLRSCFTNLPVYQMLLNSIPNSVAKKIKKMMRDFLWDGIEFAPQKGGLGIRKIRTFNQALLCKWWWRNIHLKNHLWYRVLCAKYGLDKSLMWLEGGRRKTVSPLWKNILSCRQIISGYFRWNVGNGVQVSFWHHKLLGDYPLKSRFLDLFKMMARPDMLVSETIERRSQNISWDIFVAFSRLNNTLLAQWCQLMKLLDKVYISQNAKDELIWEIESDGIFLVKSCYNLFVHDRWKWSCTQIAQIRKWPIPHKVQIFIWLAAQDRIPTIDNLIKRGKIIPNVCIFCKDDGEPGAHLFIHCSFTTRFWYWSL
ncbi:hypothetical protein AMTRI_Chr05g63140 [Amborella trichopoda]